MPQAPMLAANLFTDVSIGLHFDRYMYSLTCTCRLLLKVHNYALGYT